VGVEGVDVVVAGTATAATVTAVPLDARVGWVTWEPVAVLALCATPVEGSRLMEPDTL